jgi:integrase
VSYKLKFLAKQVNLNDSEAVNTFIASMNTANSYKNTVAKAYAYYVKYNGLMWSKPKFRYERKAIRIPTEETINTIIEGSSKKYSAIFTILKECGMMPYELSKVSLSDIDLERGILNVQGFKGHTSRSFKLKSETLAKLKWYVNHYGDSVKLFPDAEWIERAWRTYRNRVSKQLQNPSLRNIRLYDLRHFFASMFYHRYRDLIALMQMMGHKKLQTVMVYTQLLGYQSDDYTSSVAKDIQEAQKLVESGFEYVTTFDGLMLFRKRK